MYKKMGPKYAHLLTTFIKFEQEIHRGTDEQRNMTDGPTEFRDQVALGRKQRKKSLNLILLAIFHTVIVFEVPSEDLVYQHWPVDRKEVCTTLLCHQDPPS